MARMSWRRPSRRESYAIFSVAASLVIVVFVYFWVVKPRLRGFTPPPVKVGAGTTKPVLRPPQTVAVTEPATPAPIVPEKGYEDMRALANKTLDQNRELIAQNNKLIEAWKASDAGKLELAKANASLAGQVRRLGDKSIVLRRVWRSSERNPDYIYPVATSIEYVGCPCPPVR